ncbi:coenzyme F390 synthetase [Deinococcus aerius]|uniref:Coenzyme F390 synthetase n=2 Tax=Deinococcus TaxID=1298 RepID=A0A2I9DJ77_9DEIO|nr:MULTISPECIES: phenylacetate--CoA ligase family protein [Deinococcus]MBB5293722.1 phenylacetate-coenzyme A ligase PaaK-like adenylate-forming protein [Deinococcus metallilatus]QBY07312.1 phenylacetate--CoA ligase family protein [Deinococcus metallilatus]RXJ14786.1 phenylacetate--CoA ligase family protein [Deinococcus metallilatus]TLK30906.1 phenylacetate--CoA ligase family protein [Deinococcus metallilatus]GBF04831.1 coenzyme F390 synthetase [Deinococcus aerius]
MNARLLAEVLLKRRTLRTHDAWSRQQLERHQERALATLRRFALARSPFYRRFHQGLEDRPLHELPVLTKSELMSRYDELVTDRAVHLEDVRAHLAAPGGGKPFLGRYQVNATAGSTGHPGLFLFNREEWSWVLASYARMYAWSGIRADLTHHPRLAVVSTTHPWHQSASVGASVQSPLVPTLRLDADQPLPELVAALNAWQPEGLVAYAGTAHQLAGAQLSGELHIRPRAVLTASEVLTGEARRRITSAWGKRPFNEYGATETAGIAGECAHHDGLHLYEDLLVIEVVDAHHRPVPPGETGERLLVSVLFSRTLPLIRYELTDRVRLDTGRCACGMPYRRLTAIEGRAEEVLRLPGARGTVVTVHPNVFHDLMDAVPVSQWQVVLTGSAVRVRVTGPGATLTPGSVEANVAAALERRGVISPDVRVEVVEQLSRTALGKTPLIRVESAEPPGRADR